MKIAVVISTTITIIISKALKRRAAKEGLVKDVFLALDAAREWLRRDKTRRRREPPFRFLVRFTASSFPARDCNKGAAKGQAKPAKGVAFHIINLAHKVSDADPRAGRPDMVMPWPVCRYGTALRT
ncbi:MAG: hypothetical protein CMN78_04560 [Spirochaetales bacterium]|nr:hypothetical protein [Spirochaetales bacterium]